MFNVIIGILIIIIGACIVFCGCHYIAISFFEKRDNKHLHEIDRFLNNQKIEQVDYRNPGEYTKKKNYRPVSTPISQDSNIKSAAQLIYENSVNYNDIQDLYPGQVLNLGNNPGEIINFSNPVNCRVSTTGNKIIDIHMLEISEYIDVMLLYSFSARLDNIRFIDLDSFVKIEFRTSQGETYGLTVIEAYFRLNKLDFIKEEIDDLFNYEKPS